MLRALTGRTSVRRFVLPLCVMLAAVPAWWLLSTWLHRRLHVDPLTARFAPPLAVCVVGMLVDLMKPGGRQAATATSRFEAVHRVSRLVISVAFALILVADLLSRRKPSPSDGWSLVFLSLGILSDRIDRLPRPYTQVSLGLPIAIVAGLAALLHGCYRPGAASWALEPLLLALLLSSLLQASWADSRTR